MGDNPPYRNSPIRYLRAINVIPGWRRGLTAQFQRLEYQQVKAREVPELIDLDPNDGS